MRIQSQIKVTVRNRVIGGPRPLVCLPLVAGDETELLGQAEELAGLEPDLLEWRADAFDRAEDVPACLAALGRLRRTIEDIPLIFTCRAGSEGGFRSLAQEVRVELLKRAAAGGQADLVDLELATGPRIIEEVRRVVRESGARLILSHHDFARTPSEEAILHHLLAAQDLGADVAKVAVTPQGPEDVLRLLGATLKARTGALRIPLVAISMGPAGAITRLAGGLFGSDVTFALGRAESAPGQIPLAALRQAMDLFYG